MNVLVINGSPREKGNSDLLCDEFIRGAEEAGHDGKGGLKRNADDLAMILDNLGNRVRKIIWSECLDRTHEERSEDARSELEE